MEEDAEKTKKDSEALMEHLRKNPPRVKSISEVASLLHVISAEQRSCNVLRSCVDKVLMNMSNIRTLRDIIERLRSVSRTNGFRFELPTSAGPETRCQLVSDMFSVKIVLGTLNIPDHSPTVLDVSIKHKEDYRSSPHLANVIRAGNFLELSNHLKGLMEMYSTSGSRQSRTRVYMALQSLETDLVKMSQMYRETHKDASVFEITMEGTVGFLTPRLAGDRPHFAYYISPYDLIDTKANCRMNLKDRVPRNIGLHAEVSIEQRSSSSSLPISPLISNKHPIDSSGMPRFMEVSHHNSTSVPACFVLHLKPAVPVLHKLVDDIKRVTGLELSTDENSSKRYLELLNAEKITYKVLMEDATHVYYLDMSEQKAALVSKVYFSQPGHLTKILECLRKQAHLNTLISSCVRDLSTVPKKGREWYFEVSLSKDIGRVSVTMEHPCSKGTAILEINLEKSGFPSCKIFTGRGDPPLCADDFVVKILQKCSSLPITMRKVIEQSIKNPKKELDIKRSRPLFPPPAPQPPTILTPVPKPMLPQQQRQQSISFEPSFQATMPDVFSPVQTQAPCSATMPKKCFENPMLTKLLVPSTSADTAEPADQPVKNHPMLLTLLKDDSEDRPQGGQQRGGKTGHMNPQNPFGFMGTSSQGHFNPSSNPMAMMTHSSGYPNTDPQIPVPASPMPPPSYPSPLSQSQMSQPGPGQMPSMSPAYQSSRSPMGGLDDMNGPVTPLNPLGMMSPGLISPGISQQPNMQRGRKASRQKSHSADNHDFPSFDPPAYDTQASMESDTSITELLGMQNRGGMTPLRRTDSSSSETVFSSHMPLQHSVSLKTISASSNNQNLLTRSVSVSSAKSGRSMASPGPRGLRTPDGLMALASPPMFEMNSNQRGPRVRSIDSDIFRSPLPSTSPGALNLPLSGGGPMHDPESDPFTFDDNKNPSKISMPDTPSTPGSRTPKQSSIHSSMEDDTLRELAKTKPVLLRALTGDANVMKSEAQSSLQRQLGISMAGAVLNNTSSGMITQTTSPAISSGFDFPKKLMTSATTATVGDKSLVRQNAVEKPGTSAAAQQAKGGEIKPDKAVKKRNSYKGEEGKAVAKKRGRPPSINHGGKRKRDGLGEAGSNQSITLNIQLSASGAPISSTTKTKPAPGSAPPNKNQTNNSSSTSAAGAAGGQTPGPTPPKFGNQVLENYFKSQEELQKRKEMKEKKGIAKPISNKQSFGGQSSSSMDLSSSEKTPLSTPQGKTGTSPRNITGLPAPRKRKSSIKDIVERLHSSKMPEVGPGGSSGSASPETTKQTIEKDANSNLLSKTKQFQQSPTFQKIIPSMNDKTVKSLPGQKPVKITGSKSSVPGILTKQGSFTPVTGTKGRSSDLVLENKAGNTESMSEVLKQINEAAAASTKRNTVPGPLNKPGSAKVPRPAQAVKPRSITPTGVAPSLTTVQRKSPSSQMMKTLSSDLSGRPVPLKMTASQGGASTPILKKSPMRIQSTGAGVPSRPSSTSSMEPLMQIMKGSGTSTASPLMNLGRKVQQDDQHFVAPSISPTPKRNSSPQVQRTTSPLTRIDDKAKGLPGRSPKRPSPTPTRISTPVQSNTPSPDGRLLIDDPSIPVPGVPLASLSRDDQRPLFIPGSRTNERQSPERTVMASPLSPQQKGSSGHMQSAKRAPTPRSSITSPGMSPLTSSSPFLIDDDLMNQAVTG